MDTHLANPVLWPTKVYMSQGHPVTFLRGVQYKLYGESASLRRTYIYQYTCSQFFLGQAVKVKTNSRTQLYWCYMYFKSLIITCEFTGLSIYRHLVLIHINYYVICDVPGLSLYKHLLLWEEAMNKYL